MAGWVSALTVHAEFRQASHWASQLVDLLESIGDRQLSVGLLYAAATAKLQCGAAAECQRLSQRAIDLADGDATIGNLVISSPLAGALMLRGCARGTLGDPGWRADVERSATMVRDFGVTMRAVMLVFKYSLTVNGALLPDVAALDEAAEVLETAERSGDDFTLSCARYVRGLTLLMHGSTDEGIQLLVAAREAAVQERFTMAIIGFIDIHLVNHETRTGDLDKAVEFARGVEEADYRSGGTLIRAAAVAALVDALLSRRAPADIQEAQAAVERLAAEPTESGSIMNELWLLRMRALLANALGEGAAYRAYRDRYRQMANSCCFEGHIAWAEEMA
jgi:adenylate cyclase